MIQIVSEEPVYLQASVDMEASGEPTTPKSKLLQLIPTAHPEKMESHFYEAVAALLSQLARDVVEVSLREYVVLFERFAGEPLHYSQVKALTSGDRWQDVMLVNKLTVGPQGTDIRFKHDLDFVRARLLQPYRDCTTCLREFPRPDAKLKETVNRPLLWQVREEEEHIKKGFDRVEQIVNVNLYNMDKALELYEPFTFLLTEEEKLPAFFEDQSNTREKYALYLQHLRDTVSKLREQCPNLLNMQMMRVDAAEVNQKLEQCADDCVSKILRFLAIRNQDRSARPALRDGLWRKEAETTKQCFEAAYVKVL